MPWVWGEWLHRQEAAQNKSSQFFQEWNQLSSLHGNTKVEWVAVVICFLISLTAKPPFLIWRPLLYLSFFNFKKAQGLPEWSRSPRNGAWFNWNLPRLDPSRFCNSPVCPLCAMAWFGALGKPLGSFLGWSTSQHFRWARFVRTRFHVLQECTGTPREVLETIWCALGRLARTQLLPFRFLFHTKQWAYCSLTDFR